MWKRLLNTIWFLPALSLFLVVVVVTLIWPAMKGETSLSPGISIGSLTLHWYGLIQGIAILVAYSIATHIAKQRDVPISLLDRAILWMLPLGYIGARIYYVLFQWDLYRAHPLSAFAIWEGGLAIHGALIGGVIGIAIALRKSPKGSRGHDALRIMDVIAPGLILAQVIGRFGNFVNQEAFGRPTSLPWGLFIDMLHRPFGFAGSAFFHPTFLYEAIGNVVIFSVLWWVSLRNRLTPLGRVTGMYLMLYGILRFGVEGLRLDSLLLGNTRIAQIVSVAFVVIGISLIAYAQMKHRAPTNVSTRDMRTKQ